MLYNLRPSTFIGMNVLSRKEVKMRPRKWTETAIQQAFDNFIKTHNRLPTKQEMYKKYNGKFPRPLSVKLALGKTIGEYLEINYTSYLQRCQSRVYGRMPKEYWIDDFKKQYAKLNHPIESEYNALREPKTPNTQTLAKIIGVSTWGEVLNYCGFEKDTKVELRAELDFEETLDNYQKLNSKLQEILKNFE